MINIRSLSLSDFFLIIGISMSSMTNLRVWKAGPSEVIMFLWSFYIFYKYSLNIEVGFIGNFWFRWCALITIGTLVSLGFIQANTDPLGLTVYYYYIPICLGLYNGLNHKSLAEIETILKAFFITSGFLYGFLYFYGIFFSSSFLGIPLFFARVRFTGGAINPHQLGLFSGSMFFLGIYLTTRMYDKKLYNLIFLLITILFYIISMATLSSTLLVSVVLAFISGGAFLLKNKPNRLASGQLISLSFLILIVFLFFKGEDLIQFFFDWVKSDPNGEGRFILWSLAPKVIAKSFFFGLGPGGYSVGGFEFHNTYIEVFAISGFLGFLNMLFLYWSIMKKIHNNTFFVMLFVFLLGYNVGGYAMRRMAFWIIVIFIVVIAEKQTSLQSSFLKRFNPVEFHTNNSTFAEP